MGTEEFWIPAVIGALGAGAQAVNTKQASSRADADETQNIIDQQNLQQKARGQVNSLTQQISKNDPQQIAGQATADYVSQLRKNSAGGSQPNAGTSALAPVSGGSSRYSTDVGKSQQQVGDYGNNLASEMGNIDAGVRQRQNEGLGMQTLGTSLNTLGAQSYTKNFVNQLRAQADGQANPWVSLFANLAQNGAKNYTPSGSQALTTGSSINPYYAPASGLVSTPQV